MNTKQGGFIPLLVIILLGLMVIAGGTATAISVHNKAQVADQLVTETEVEATTTPSGAVSPRVESSIKVATSTSPTVNSEPVEAVKPQVETKVVLDAETRAICADTTVQASTEGTSLLGDLKILCDRMELGRYKDEGLTKAVERLKERWSYWLKVQEVQKSNENRAKDIEDAE